MNAQEELKRVNTVFNTAWRYMKRRIPLMMRDGDKDEFWGDLINEACVICKQADNDEFCRSVIIECMGELERMHKQQKEGKT